MAEKKFLKSKADRLTLRVTPEIYKRFWDHVEKNGSSMQAVLEAALLSYLSKQNAAREPEIKSVLTRIAELLERQEKRETSTKR